MVGILTSLACSLYRAKLEHLSLNAVTLFRENMNNFTYEFKNVVLYENGVSYL